MNSASPAKPGFFVAIKTLSLRRSIADDTIAAFIE
jgi:hypothetical protein